MPGARESAIFAAIAVACSSCNSRIVTRLELSSLGIQYGFSVVFDAYDTPTRVSKPFALAGGKLSFGELPALHLRDDEATFVIIGLDDELLGAAVFGFDPVRARELAISVDPPPVKPELEAADAARPMKASPIPATAMFFTANADQGGDAPLERIEPSLHPSIAERLTLHVPVDPEHCRIPDQAPLTNFTPDALIFAHFGLQMLGILSDYIHQLIYLDEDHLLALTSTHLAIVERGRRVTADRLVRLSFEPPSENIGVVTTGMALDPTTARSPMRRVIVTGLRQDGPGGLIWEVLLDQNGGTLTSTIATVERATSVAFLPDGTAFVGFEGSIVRRRLPGETEYGHQVQLPRYFEDGDDFARLRYTGDPQKPIVAGAEARIHQWDAIDDRWTFEEIFQLGLNAAEPLQFYAIDAVPTRSPQEPVELWAGGQRGHLFKKVGDGKWKYQEISYPPRFAPCGSIDETTGQLIFQDRFATVSGTRDYVFLTILECSAMLQLRREDGCLSLLGRPTDGIQRSNIWNIANAAREGRAAIAGIGGFILESTWPTGQ